MMHPTASRPRTFRPMLSPGLPAVNDNFQSVAAFLPLGDGRLLTASIERTQPHIAVLAVSAFISQGTRLISNLFGALSARSSSFFPLVNGSAKPTNGVTLALKIPPVPFVAAAHDVNSSNGVGVCPTKEFPKQERVFPRIA